MNDIYVTAEYPNPPIRYIPIHQPCGIRVEEYTPPSIKEKIKAYINSIYSTKCLKRKETQEMKFGIGDHVSELELVGSYKGPAKFTKADLKDGMVVVTGENYDFKYFIHNDSLIQKDNWVTLDKYNDDLKYKDRDYDYMDIQAVYRSTAYTFEDMFNDRFLELIWERKPKYKVGDRVKFKDDLNGAFDIYMWPEMKAMAGRIVTVKSVYPYGPFISYQFDETSYMFSEDTIEGLVDYEEMTVAEIEKKLGYKVKIVDGE